MTEKLKPCPCGETPKICKSPSGKTFFVSCKCGLCTPKYKERNTAANAWNAAVKAMKS